MGALSSWACSSVGTPAQTVLVMDARNCCLKFLTRIWSDGPGHMQSLSTVNALSALVSSVSHNALASALPNQPPSNQQQFNGRLKLVASQYDCGAV